MRHLFNMSTPQSEEHDISSIGGFKYMIARAMDKDEEHDNLVAVVNLYLSEDRPESGILASRVRNFDTWGDFKMETYGILWDLQVRGIFDRLLDNGLMSENILYFAEFLAVLGYNLEDEDEFREFELEEVLGIFCQFMYMREHLLATAALVAEYRKSNQTGTWEMDIGEETNIFDFENDPEAAFNAVRVMMEDENNETASILMAAHAAYLMSK